MDIHKFRKLIEAYGTNSDVWPSDQKQSALAFLNQSHQDLTRVSALDNPDASSIIKEFELLDKVLDADIVDESPTLKLAILSKIHQADSVSYENNAIVSADTGVKNKQPEDKKPGLLNNLWDWLTPSPLGSFVIWRPAMAACIPLLAGVYLGTMVDPLTSDSLAEWEEDIYVMGLVPEFEEEE